MLTPNFSPFPEIKTKRLLLRKIVKSDAPEILSLRSSEEVMRYIDRERAQSIKDAEDYIQKIEDALVNNDGITWAITLLDKPEKLIGTIGYWRFEKEHHRAEIGYMLHPHFWKQGITKEAILILLDYAFNEIKLHSIEANINPANTASANILEATGFLKEAYFKENYYFNGIFHDSIIYSRLQ